MSDLSTHEGFKRGAADAGPFFNYSADFIDFTDEDVACGTPDQPIKSYHLTVEAAIGRVSRS